MFQTYLTKLAVTLRGVPPRRNLFFEDGRKIELAYGLQLVAVAQAGAYMSVTWILFHAPTLIGQGLMLAFLVASLYFAIPLALGLLRPTARAGAGGVILERMPLVALRRQTLPCGDFSLGLRPHVWSRSSGRRQQKRTERAFGWALTLEHPRMLPIVLEMRWQGYGADDLPDDVAALARADDLARQLGLRGVVTFKA